MIATTGPAVGWGVLQKWTGDDGCACQEGTGQRCRGADRQLLARTPAILLQAVDEVA